MTSRTSKNTRPALGRARKATDSTRVRRDPITYFSHDGLPIGGLPDPLDCPFCGKNEVSIEFENGTAGTDENPTSWRVGHAHCDNCGARGGWVPRNDEFPDDYSVVREAARMWNTRKGGTR